MIFGREGKVIGDHKVRLIKIFIIALSTTITLAYINGDLQL